MSGPSASATGGLHAGNHDRVQKHLDGVSDGRFDSTERLWSQNRNVKGRGQCKEQCRHMGERQGTSPAANSAENLKRPVDTLEDAQRQQWSNSAGRGLCVCAAVSDQVRPPSVLRYAQEVQQRTHLGQSVQLCVPERCRRRLRGIRAACGSEAHELVVPKGLRATFEGDEPR